MNVKVSYTVHAIYKSHVYEVGKDYESHSSHFDNMSLATAMDKFLEQLAKREPHGYTITKMEIIGAITA